MAVPKSVSLLWGLGDRDLAAEVAEAHHGAVTAALGYLERTAGFTRTGKNGVDWEPVVNGVAEVVGIDGDLCRRFSKRREAIEDKLAEWETSSGVAAEQAALRTRQAKTAAEPTALLKARWRAEAQDAGWRPDADLTSVIDASRAAPFAVDTDVTTAAIDDLAGAEGVTEQRSSFDRRDVIRHLTAVLPGAVGAAQLEEIADAFLAHPAVRRVRSGHPETAFTTAELLATEQRLLADAVRRLADACGLVDSVTVDRAIGDRPSLAEEQADLVRRLPTVRLATNRRQQDAMEADALDQLRHGRVEPALSTFVDHDRTVGTNSDAVRQTMVDDWWRHACEGTDVLMRAPTS